MKNSFELFGLTIHWYGVILTFAMLMALVLFTYLCHKRELSTDFALSIFLFAVVFAIIGARAFYVAPRAEYWQDFDSFLRVFNISEGGLTIMGAIPVGAFGVWIACRISRKSPLRVLDVVVPAMLLGQIIGRWGNFVNQEVHGVPIVEEWLKFFPMGVNINGVWYYASFFYEMMLNLVGLIICLVIFFKVGSKLKTGMMTLGYLGWYALVRGCLEFVKEGPLMAGGIKVTQLICFIMIPIVIVLMILTQKGIIKFETRDMYMKHFNLAYEPPAYVEMPNVDGNSSSSGSVSSVNKGDDIS